MTIYLFRYIILLITIFIIFFIYCHSLQLKKINNELKILQVTDPEPNLIYELFDNHQPIVFQQELYFWKEFNSLIGMSLVDINNSITTNKNINYSEYIKNNIEIYNLPLSYDWNIDIRNITLNESSAIFFVKQNNYMQMFGCVTGEIRIIIATPDQSLLLEPLSNMVSTIDATSILNKEPLEINYIEVIVRKGNMVYVPWGWFYFIYNGSYNNECVIVDCENKSALSFI